MFIYKLIGDLGNLINSNINQLTIGILLWTAIEAFRSARAANQDNIIKLLPILVVQFLKGSSTDSKLIIKNLGEGVAYDIKIEPWILFLMDWRQIWRMEAFINSTNILAKNALGTSYYTELGTGVGGINIITPPKMLDVRSRIWLTLSLGVIPWLKVLCINLAFATITLYDRVSNKLYRYFKRS